MTRTLVCFADLQHAVRRLRPQTALILGSGMAALAGRLDQACSVAFVDVPGLAPTTTPGHSGYLSLCVWGKHPILVFEGRLHSYEGCSWREVTAAVRTASFLGARLLLLSNAVGAVDDDLAPGSLVAIRDHLEWTSPYCWRRPGPFALGHSGASPYSRELLALLHQGAKAAAVELHEGVLAAVLGPSYETAAEVRALRNLGAHVVGMSVAREAQAAYDLGLACGAISCVSNWAAGKATGPLRHEEVLHVVQAQAHRLAALLQAFLNLQAGLMTD